MGCCLEMVLVLGVLTVVNRASLLNLHRRDLDKATSSGFANYKDAQDTHSALKHLEAGQGATHGNQYIVIRLEPGYLKDIRMPVDTTKGRSFHHLTAKSVKNCTVYFPEEKNSKIQVEFDQEAIQELPGSSRRVYEDESVENNIIKLIGKAKQNIYETSMAIGYLFCCKFKRCECRKKDI